MPFGKLNPAVKTAISCGAVAVQGSAYLLLTLLTGSPSGAVLWNSMEWSERWLLFLERRQICQRTKEWK